MLLPLEPDHDMRGGEEIDLADPEREESLPFGNDRMDIYPAHPFFRGHRIPNYILLKD